MESIKDLRKICQSKSFTEHFTLRVFRVFSIYITRIFLPLKFSPNFVSFLGFFVGIAGGYLYVKDSFILGSILFLLFFVLDVVDGEIARYRKKTSHFGGWLDTTLGHLLYPYFFIMFGLGVYFQTNEFIYAYLGVLIAVFKMIDRSIIQLPPNVKNTQHQKEIKNNYNLISWIDHVGKFPIIFPLALIAGMTGGEKMFIWFYLALLIVFGLGKTIKKGITIHKMSSEK